MASTLRRDLRSVTLMRKQREHGKSSSEHPGSLLAPEAMGGINAGKGFDFQTRFAACQLPVWLLEPGFAQLFHEGSGDIDIRYQDKEASTRIHMQVKDHEVAPAEFKASLTHFLRLHADLPGVYRSFILVCPALSSKMRPVEASLARYRHAKPFYDDAPTALGPTKAELDDRLKHVGLDDGEIAFMLDFVTFEIGHADLLHDERALETFVARLLNHPEYADRIRAAVQPAFAALLRALEGRRGQVLSRHDVEQLLRAAVSEAAHPEEAIAIWLHNWTREVFDTPANYTVDWSEHFDRATRRVPSEETWNKSLIPEMTALRDRILVQRGERLIRFRGKCALSSGVALGAAFPAVGGWIFELPQPPAAGLWRSDATPATPYDLHVEIDEGESRGSDLVLGLNVRGDGRGDIRRYITRIGKPPKLIAFLSPPTIGNGSIAGPEEACAFARAAREQLGQLLKAHDIRHTRLFLYGPLALAVFLGQQLTSVGEIQLFEYQDPGYTPSCTLST